MTNFFGEQSKHWRTSAQAATELAVFGSIFIFILGAMVAQSLALSTQQNQNLKAMRLALRMSYEYSEGLKIGSCQGAGDEGLCKSDGVVSRNQASVLFIEDRLTSDSAKFGAVDRFPQMASGAGAHTRLFQMPIDAWEDWNLPVMDMFINGKHFPFTTARFKKECLAQLRTQCSSDA